MNRLFVMLAVTGGLTVPAAGQYPAPITAWFPSPDRGAVMDRLTALCADWGIAVASRSDRYLVCARDASAAAKVAVQATGSGYGSSASYVLSFSVHDDRGASRVEAVQYIASAGSAMGRNFGPRPLGFQKYRRALIGALADAGGSPTRPPKR